MRISDWSSDVCSSDLPSDSLPLHLPPHGLHRSPPVRRLDSGELGNVEPGLFEHRLGMAERPKAVAAMICPHPRRPDAAERDRKSVVEGKSVSVRVGLGGRRTIYKKTRSQTTKNTHHT